LEKVNVGVSLFLMGDRGCFKLSTTDSTELIVGIVGIVSQEEI